DGRLSGLRIERTRLEQYVGFGAFQPLADIARRIPDRRKMAAERGNGVEAIGLGDPAAAARGDAGEPPANVIFAAQLTFLGNEQSQQGTSHVPEPDDGEIVGRNERSPGNRMRSNLGRSVPSANLF